VRLGNPTNADECLEQARTARSAKARQRAENVRPVIGQIVRSGANTLRAIAAALAARGVKTARGSTRWHPEQVAAVLRITNEHAPPAITAKLLLDGHRLNPESVRGLLARSEVGCGDAADGDGGARPSAMSHTDAVGSSD
jgi:hypothetical protein